MAVKEGKRDRLQRAGRNGRKEEGKVTRLRRVNRKEIWDRISSRGRHGDVGKKMERKEE